jgi:dTDP-4-amino-4,6-dideoxygalactose transaminase
VRFAPGADAQHQPNGWLACLTIDSEVAGVDRERVRRALRRQGIEARPIWKPMHLQPVFAANRYVGGHVSDRLFAHGLCLPSGSSLTDGDLDEVCERILDTFDGRDG